MLNELMQRYPELESCKAEIISAADAIIKARLLPSDTPCVGTLTTEICRLICLSEVSEMSR